MNLRHKLIYLENSFSVGKCAEYLLVKLHAPFSHTFSWKMIVCKKLICVAANGVMRFRCVAPAAHFLYLEEFMAIAFFGTSDFSTVERQNDCNCAIVDSLVSIETPEELYFTGDNEFISCMYKWCKEYQKTMEKLRLIYVASDEDSEEFLEQKRQEYDLVIHPQINKPKPDGISVAEQFMVDCCNYIVVYCKGGMNQCPIAFHAYMRGRYIVDYYAEQNQLAYYSNYTMYISDEVFWHYGIHHIVDFSKRLAVYMQMHKELLEDEEHRAFYDALLIYLVENLDVNREVIFFEFEKSKELLMRELEALAEEGRETQQVPCTEKEFNSFYNYYIKFWKKDSYNHAIPTQY